jgi:hypothetical protein
MFGRRRSKTHSTTNSNGSATGTGAGGGGGGSGSISDGASANSSQASSALLLRSCLRQEPTAEGHHQPQQLQTSDSRSNGGEKGGGGSLGTLTNESQGGATAKGDRSSNRTGSSSAKVSRAALRRRVKFRHVVVREFERVIGDNPSCSGGAPVAYVLSRSCAVQRNYLLYFAVLTSSYLVDACFNV